MKTHALLLLIPFCVLCSCGSSSSVSSSAGNSRKGEEAVTTVDKETFEKLITNAGLIDSWDANLSLKYQSSAGETSVIKRVTYAVELDMNYPGVGLAPVKYYSLDLEKAWVTLMNPAAGMVAGYFSVTHDEAMKDILDAVGIVGSGFAYNSFSYSESTKSYHAESAKSAAGVDLVNVDFYFENGRFQKASGTEKTAEGQCDFQIVAYDYGATEIKIPY